MDFFHTGNGSSHERPDIGNCGLARIGIHLAMGVQ